MKPSKVKKVKTPKFEDVRKWFDENLDAEHCDLDDQEVYSNVYHDGRWAAVFQFTEKGAQKFAMKAKPRSITDIAAITSIYRPGPLTADVDKAFVADKERFEAGEEITYEHEAIEKVLSETYGHMVFQEHFMLIGKEFGLSWDDCDKLRKILVKKSIGTDVNEKKRQDAMRIKESLKTGAVEMGLTEEQVDELWRKMEFFSGYGFNKSLQGSTKIDLYDRRGNFKQASEISYIATGEYVRSRDERTGDDVFVEVKAVHDHGELDVYEFTFDDGSSVECTPNHKFRTADGRMLPIKEIVRLGLDVVSARHEAVTGMTVRRSSDEKE